MKDENFFTVKGWMVNRLKLKGNELMVYAIIYGFSQNGEFHKISTRYISEAIGGVDAKTARAAIESLEKKGLIQKDQEDVAGVTVNSFRVSQGMGGEKFPGGREKFPGAREKFPGGVGKNSPPIYIYNNNNNKEAQCTNRAHTRIDTPPSLAKAEEEDNAAVDEMTLHGQYPETWDEVKDEAVRFGIEMKQDEAEAFLAKYASVGWLNKFGHKITNWRILLKTWHNNWAQIEKDKKERATGGKNGCYIRGSNQGVREPYIEGRFNVAGDGYEYSDLDRIFGKESDSAGTGEAGNAGAGARP